MVTRSSLVILALLFLGSSAYEKALQQIQRETGLAPITVPDTQGDYLGKTHRGYPLLYTAKAGNVWGRYAARLTMGEIGHEVGGVVGFLTGQHEALGGNVVGMLTALVRDVVKLKRGVIVEAIAAERPADLSANACREQLRVQMNRPRPDPLELRCGRRADH